MQEGNIHVSSNLAPLGVSPELIACAIGLRFEYVGVTVLEPFWLCPEENLALNHQTDCTTSTQIWVINFDSIKSQENIFCPKPSTYPNIVIQIRGSLYPVYSNASSRNVSKTNC